MTIFYNAMLIMYNVCVFLQEQYCFSIKTTYNIYSMCFSQNLDIYKFDQIHSYTIIIICTFFHTQSLFHSHVVVCVWIYIVT